MSCSECGYRTSSVKSAGKHMGDLAPYCDHKMEFIRAKAQLEKDEICLDAILCADLPCLFVVKSWMWLLGEINLTTSSAKFTVSKNQMNRNKEMIR